ncbi:uncharacterized protein LOC109860966 [Pseudomyrmex gracilis]|uniref:uncharacterized protein LOC109860966 n=1 Tax=Pseudomyrmex gracilis TaxID=219809 RepID=UPI000994FDFB|nr:uncharacterized protein LOC109860966 [Pseudomyrmex gracilis]
MERLLANRLNWWLEFCGKLPNSQFDFRKQRSCIDNLTLLYGEIITSFQENKTVSAAFLHVQSAYDTVLADILTEKVISLWVPPQTARFVYNLVSERQITCCFGDFEDVRLVNRGLPQECVCSPILYTIYVMELDRVCLNGCKIIQNADNVCLYSSTVGINKGLNKLKKTLNNVVNVLDPLGLGLSAPKTQLCVFSQNDQKLSEAAYINSRYTYKKRTLEITIADTRVFFVFKVKFLGMIFCSNLDWTSHVMS